MTRLLIVATAAALSGCMSLAPVASAPATSVAPPRCTPDEAAALPEGARVELTNEWIVAGIVSDQTSRTRRVGTVLKSSPDGIALVNCVVESRSSAGIPVLNKTPHFSRLFRNAGVGAHTVPVLWIPIHEMGEVRVLEPPPEGYVSPAIDIDTKSRDLCERITVDVDHVTGEPSGKYFIEQVDGATGEVLRREGFVADWDSSIRIPDADLQYRRLDSTELEESPGVQSLGRRTSGHGPATPDPGTAHLNRL